MRAVSRGAISLLETVAVPRGWGVGESLFLQPCKT
jgi:hypothetical protein